jgi:hypothetical protein
LQNGIRRFRGYLLVDNRPMLDLLQEMGARVELDSPGLYRVDVDIPHRAYVLKNSALYSVFRALARGSRPWQVRFREFWTRRRTV